MSDVVVEDPGGGALCVWCAKVDIRQTGVGRRRRYCSHACRQAAYDQRRIEKRVAALAAGAEPAGTSFRQ